MDLSSVWDEPVSALIGADFLGHYDVGEDQFGPQLECADTAEGSHSVEFVDYFHAHAGVIPEALLDDGYLTKDGVAAVQHAVRSILADKNWLPAHLIEQVCVDADGIGDDPGIEVSISIPATSNLSVAEAHDTIMQPLWSAMYNMTDRGTFNWPYLYANLD